MKTYKAVRFEDTILQDIDAFAGKHKLKDQDGSYDFSDAFHQRYMELLQKEREYEQAAVDLKTWKNYAGTQEQTSKTYCSQLDMTVTPI
jgi:purine-nucleoside phosphorylase